MLVLTRDVGESVIVRTSQGAMRLTLLKTKGNSVRLGFSGSDEFTIIRPELLNRPGSHARPFSAMGVCANCFENPCVCIVDAETLLT